MDQPPNIRLAIVSNAPTPYRISLHLRICKELPSLQLWSVFTHQQSNAPWTSQPPESIRPVYFGHGESSGDQSVLSRQSHEWRKGNAIYSWMCKEQIDAVVLLGYNDAARLRILLHCASNRVPCFVFGDSNILGDRVRGLKRLTKSIYLRFIARMASGFFYCGNRGKAYFASYGSPENRLFPFPYEPDYTLLETLPAEIVESAYYTFGLNSARRRLLYAGRLAPEKRVDLLLASLNEVLQKRPDWDVVIAGDGPLRDSLKLSVPPDLRHRIIWTGFIDDPSSLAALYRVCDVFVLPSDFEPWGVVVTEAATCMALVCSDVVGAAADLVVPGRNGFTFTAGIARELEVALLRATDPALVDRLKANSPSVLQEWRQACDPINGLRAALRAAHLPI